MSAVFGIYNRNNKQIDPEILENMQTAVSWWQPDSRGCWCEGPAALGHAMLWNTAESKLEQLPCKQDHLIITMDARLDNRAELAGKLGMEDEPLEQITDSTFILAAYRRWGEECTQYLLGDFAFAIWDTKEQQLFCARDHMGIRPFYFHLTDTLFVFASDLKGLIVHPHISEEINDQAVAEFLVNALLTSTTPTFFKHIQKLPPAHTLTITTTAVRKRCYWKAEDAPEIMLPDTAAYAKRLRELLQQAVYARIRSAYPVTSHLSGGLDSSAIAVLAAGKLREKGDTLLAFNWLHEPAGDDDPAHYEWANSKIIAEKEGILHQYVPLSGDDIYQYMSGRNIAHGDTANLWYEYPVRKAVQEEGSRTILSGWGGDELSSYHGQSYFANMVKEGRLLTMQREIRLMAQQNDKQMKTLLSIMYHRVFLPFVPRKLHSKMPMSKSFDQLSYQFIRQEFMPVVNRERNKVVPLTMQPQTTIRENMLAFLHNGHIQGRIDSWAASAFANRLEYRYPLLDKRIVEFILGVPPVHFIRQGRKRYLFKAAVDGLVSPEVLQNMYKFEPQRVNHFVSISYPVFQAMIKNMLGNRIHSSYADFIKLEEMLHHSPENDDKLILVMTLNTLLLLIQCEIHQSANC